jgi:hypothetical protein
MFYNSYLSQEVSFKKRLDMLNRLLILLIGIVFVGCAGEHKSTESIVEEKTPVVDVGMFFEEPKIDVTTETRYTYIKEISTYKADVYIVVDYVDYFEGDEALEMEWRDKAYLIIDGDTMTGITDGYYISNMNNKLRTFKVSQDASIDNIIDGDGPHSLKGERVLSIPQLKDYIKHNNLLILHVKDGVVESFDEIFLPRRC